MTHIVSKKKNKKKSSPVEVMTLYVTHINENELKLGHNCISLLEHTCKT